MVRLAALPTVAATQLPSCISKFRKSAAHTSFVVKDAVKARIRELVRNEEVDIGIVHREESLQDFDVTDLFEDRMVAVYPPRHPLSRLPTLTLSTRR